MEDIINLLETYTITSILNRAAHYRAANDARIKHYWLGIPSIIISTAIGTSIFASLNNNPTNELKIIVGLVSFLSAVLSSLQTFFKFSEAAEKHRVAGAAYGDVKRKLDILKLEYSMKDHTSREDALKELTLVSEILGELAKESPGIPDKAFKQAKDIESENLNQK
jgi:hypothetical protein